MSPLSVRGMYRADEDYFTASVTWPENISSDESWSYRLFHFILEVGASFVGGAWFWLVVIYSGFPKKKQKREQKKLDLHLYVEVRFPCLVFDGHQLHGSTLPREPMT